MSKITQEEAVEAKRILVEYLQDRLSISDSDGYLNVNDNNRRNELVAYLALTDDYFL